MELYNMYSYPVSFSTQQNVYKIHPCCGCCIVFHCIDVVQSIYSPIDGHMAVSSLVLL